jgi:hypothetical protein
MTSYTLRVTVALVFLTVCIGQVGTSHDTDPGAGLWLIHRILLAGQVSGSLSYSGCGFDKHVPPNLPPFGVLEESGPPEEILRKLLSADPLAKVTRDGSMIRMMETNVATDLLNIKIHHVTFFSPDAPASDPVHGPRMALLAILESPEVIAFGKEHNIRGLSYPGLGITMPGDCCGSGRIVQGQLDNVTVSQALDYVLQTFPGFCMPNGPASHPAWVYRLAALFAVDRFDFSALASVRPTIAPHRTVRCPRKFARPLIPST